MNDSERELVSARRSREISDNEFLSRFPSGVDAEYIKRSLEKAIGEQNGSDVEDLLYVGFLFSIFSSVHCDVLCALLTSSWHHSHEDIARILQKLKMPESIDSLAEATSVRHDYLEYNDSTAFAVKCLWALYEIGTDTALVELSRIARTDEREEVKNVAEAHIESLITPRAPEEGVGFRRRRRPPRLS